MTDLSEIDETKLLLKSVKNVSLKLHLEKHLKQLEDAAAAAASHKIPTETTEVYSVTEPTPTEIKETKLLSESVSHNVNSSTQKAGPIVSTGKFIPIENFAWDQDGYSAPVISVYIDLPGVGKAKQNCDVSFTKTSFDFSVTNVDGKNYRLVKDNLEKDIIPGESKMIVKSNRVILKLQKVKGEYSYDHWNNLTAKKPRSSQDEAKKKDPTAGLMDMMKDVRQ